MSKRDIHPRKVHIKASVNKKSSRPQSEGGIKDVEPRVECNSKLQRARFYGVSMQRRPSISEQPFVLSSNNINQQHKNKSQQKILSSQQVFPSSLHKSNSILNDTEKPRLINSISNQNSRRNSIFTQHDASIVSEEINQKKKESWCTRRKVILFSTISILLVLIIILSVVLPLKLNNSQTSNQSNTQNYVCISGSPICSTPIFYWNYYCNSVPYSYYTCCYLSPTSKQLTINFQLQEDFSYWSIDDVSATQNNGELITNGGFESNLNGWTVTVSSNATSTTYVQYLASSSHSGLAYLYSQSKNGSTSVTQTFNVIQGQNINVSFWWADGGNSVYVPGKICQAIVTLT